MTLKAETVIFKEFGTFSISKVLTTDKCNYITSWRRKLKNNKLAYNLNQN